MAGVDPLTSMGGTDVYLAKLDPNGNYLWSKRFGDSSAQLGGAVSIDSKGQPVIVGTFAGTIDFGGGPLVSSGGPVSGSDIFVAKFDAAGNHLWSRRFGDSSGQTLAGVSFDSTGNALMAGTFNGLIDFGGNPMTNTGGSDIFLAKLRTP